VETSISTPCHLPRTHSTSTSTGLFNLTPSLYRTKTSRSCIIYFRTAFRETYRQNYLMTRWYCGRLGTAYLLASRKLSDLAFILGLAMGRYIKLQLLVIVLISLYRLAKMKLVTLLPLQSSWRSHFYYPTLKPRERIL
jgi:hypothetical protein